MTEEERKKEFASMCETLHPQKHRRAVVVAEFLGISAHTVRIYTSKSPKAPSAALLELFRMKIKNRQS